MSLAEHWIGAFGAGSPIPTFSSSRIGMATKAGSTTSPSPRCIPRRSGTARWTTPTGSGSSVSAKSAATTGDRSSPSAPRRTPATRHPGYAFSPARTPGYPEEILRAALGTARWRLDQIQGDAADLREVNIHHWQQLNPVTTEALVQLTLGAPAPIYNGGLLFAPGIRYFDVARQRRAFHGRRRARHWPVRRRNERRVCEPQRPREVAR